MNKNMFTLLGTLGFIVILLVIGFIVFAAIALAPAIRSWK